MVSCHPSRLIPRLTIIVLAVVLTGCATYYQPRYGDDGVYYDPPQVQHRAVHVDPLLYPYWSLDYFYFSRHYHPYSVLVDFYEPGYYPYPGWYYGYRAAPRTRVSISYGHHWYPWYGFGPHYHYYQPWGFRYIHYPRYRHPGWAHQPHVRQVDERLREMERRQRTQAAVYRDPRSPNFHADGISTRRSAADSRQSGQQQRQASDVRRSIQQREQSSTAGVPRARQPAPRVLEPRGQHESTSERPAIRGGNPRQTPQPAPRQRQGIPTRDIPRQQPTRPDERRQGPSSRERGPAVQPPVSPPPRSAPTSAPPSQPTSRPQSRSPAPRQRSAPARQRQRENEPRD